MATPPAKAEASEQQAPSSAESAPQQPVSATTPPATAEASEEQAPSTAESAAATPPAASEEQVSDSAEPRDQQPLSGSTKAKATTSQQQQQQRPADSAEPPEAMPRSRPQPGESPWLSEESPADGQSQTFPPAQVELPQELPSLEPSDAPGARDLSTSPGGGSSSPSESDRRRQLRARAAGQQGYVFHRSDLEAEPPKDKDGQDNEPSKPLFKDFLQGPSDK